jgi:hypothetical protein
MLVTCRMLIFLYGRVQDVVVPKDSRCAGSLYQITLGELKCDQKYWI